MQIPTLIPTLIGILIEMNTNIDTKTNTNKRNVLYLFILKLDRKFNSKYTIYNV